MADAQKTADGAEPLTVSVSLGATIPIGDYQNIRPAVEIRNLRLDKPLEEQVKAALEAVRYAWAAVDNELEVQITEMVSGAAGIPTIRDTLDELRKWVDDVAKPNFRNIATEVKRQQTRLVALEGGVSPAEGKKEGVKVPGASSAKGRRRRRGATEA